LTELRWAPQAAEDLEAIRAFIGRDSVAYARAVVERLFLAARQLKALGRSARRTSSSA